MIKRVFVIVKKSSDSSYLLLIADKKHNIMGLSGGRYDFEDNNPIITAKRELFEETSLDIANDRFQLLGSISKKLFYLLEISDIEAESIKLSSEHLDFIFQKNKEIIPKLIKDHSSGTCAKAFIQFANLI